MRKPKEKRRVWFSGCLPGDLGTTVGIPQIAADFAAIPKSAGSGQLRTRDDKLPSISPS